MKSIVLLFALIGLFTWGMTGVGSGACPASPSSQRSALTQEPEMTEKQREHSKLYEEYNSWPKLSDIAARATSDIGFVVGTPDYGDSPNSPRFDLDKFHKDIGCTSDAVVIANVEHQSSHLTVDENFIFTDSDLTIEEVLKDNMTPHLQSGSNITVTRPGRRLQLGGRMIHALYLSYTLLEPQKLYLLFLPFIPSTAHIDHSTAVAVSEYIAKRSSSSRKSNCPVSWKGSINPHSLSPNFAPLLSVKKDKRAT